MSRNRTNSYETHEEMVTDYPALCIIMRFMSVIHTAKITPYIPTIYTARLHHRQLPPIIRYGQILDTSQLHTIMHFSVCC